MNKYLFSLQIAIIACGFALSLDAAKITIQNNSNTALWFVSVKGGKCSGYCYNPWTKSGTGWGKCCGESNPKIVQPGNSGVIDFKGGSPAFSGLPAPKPKYYIQAYAKNGQKWQTPNEILGTESNTIAFPGDFNVSSADKTALQPIKQFEEKPLFSMGTFGIINNQTSYNLKLPVGKTAQYFTIPARITTDAKKAFKLSDHRTIYFNTLWTDDTKITLTSYLTDPTQVENMKIILSFDENTNTLTILSSFLLNTQGQSEANSVISSNNIINFNILLDALNINLSPTQQVQDWSVSLTINSDGVIKINNLTISHVTADQQNPLGKTTTTILDNAQLTADQILIEQK
jgi:hypothetical protein